MLFMIFLSQFLIVNYRILPNSLRFPRSFIDAVYQSMPIFQASLLLAFSVGLGYMMRQMLNDFAMVLSILLLSIPEHVLIIGSVRCGSYNWMRWTGLPWCRVNASPSVRIVPLC
jgi:hypothetical protein